MWHHTCRKRILCQTIIFNLCWLKIQIALPWSVCNVWSVAGPVPILGVLPFCLVQSKSSVLSCVKRHIPCSQSHSAKIHTISLELDFPNDHHRKGGDFRISLKFVNRCSLAKSTLLSTDDLVMWSFPGCQFHMKVKHKQENILAELWHEVWPALWP